MNKPDKFKIECKEGMYISLEPEVYEEMMGYVDEFDTECSGCGIVEEIQHEFTDGSKETQFHVTEIFLPNQSNTAASSNVTAEETAKVVTQALMDGKDTSKMKFHWHSHVNMGVFHSVTDEENYDEFKTGEYLVSIVANKKRELLGRIDFFGRFGVKFIDLAVYVDFPSLTGVSAKVKANVKRVKEFDKLNTNSYVSYYNKGKGSYKKDPKDGIYRWVPEEESKSKDLILKPDPKPVISSSYGYHGYASEADRSTLYEVLEYGELCGVITVVHDDSGIPTGYIDTKTGKYFEVDLFESELEGQPAKGDQIDYID